MLRPEIIIPSKSTADAPTEKTAGVVAVGLTGGSRVRIIRKPGFGRLGKIKSLPSAAQAVESEAKVRVAEVEFDDGQVLTVPRANLEAIAT